MSQFAKTSKLTVSILSATLLGACTLGGNHAPVVERSKNANEAKVLAPVGPGFYRVKKGDTLYRIALEHGQSYRDITAWNNLSNPNQIEVDQVLRVAPEGKTSGVTTSAVKSTTVEGQSIDDKKVSTKPNTDKKVIDKPVAATDGTIALAWPHRGTIIGKFDETKNKGIDIAGKSGDAVHAAGDGKVVYAGNSLRGYGNLVIIKHDETYLTAYAHNKALVVAEGDVVKKGAKIAEMGDSDATRVKLHFEVRKGGKPVDPLKYLPSM